MSIIMPQKKVFLIPYWLKNILLRNQLPLATLLSLSKLKEVTSDEDLILTLILNEAGSASVYGAERAAGDANTLWTTTPEDSELFFALQTLVPLHATGLQDRLFNEQTLDAQYPEPFTVQELNQDTFLVVIYPGFFGGPQGPEHSNELVTALLKLSYGYGNYEVMARDPLFQQYLSRL